MTTHSNGDTKKRPSALRQQHSFLTELRSAQDLVRKALFYAVASVKYETEPELFDRVEQIGVKLKSIECELHSIAVDAELASKIRETRD